MQAVDGGAAAELAPSSCLSPLHWHQANLGSSRPGFYQAMVSQHRYTTRAVQTDVDARFALLRLNKVEGQLTLKNATCKRTICI